MKYRMIFILFLLVNISVNAISQEIRAKVTVNASMVGSQIDKKIFKNLESGISDLINSRKWTNESFKSSERINCNFIITIKQSLPENIYKASLVVQAVRPVYNSMYQSTLMSFQDESFTFRYVDLQAIEFNENRISGGDPYVSNLSATVAYYVYLILGLDFDSFSLKGGDPFFQKAQNVVNGAPDSRDIEGWKAFDSQRNRYWLVENLSNAKYALLHDAFYNYFRLGLDLMVENEEEARGAVLNTLNLLQTITIEHSNIMAISFFFQGKAQEIINIFKKSTQDEKIRAREILTKIDMTNSNLYKQELK